MKSCSSERKRRGESEGDPSGNRRALLLSKEAFSEAGLPGEEGERGERGGEGGGGVFFAPAGVGAGVANGTCGMHADEQGVLVAVQLDADHGEEVTARLALGPKAFAGARVESHASFGHGLLVGFTIHIAEHEHLAGVGILDDGRHEAAHLVKIDIHCLMVIPSVCK